MQRQALLSPQSCTRFTALILGLVIFGLAFSLRARPSLPLPGWHALTMEVEPALVVKIQVDPQKGSEALPHLAEYPDSLKPDPAETLYHLTVETRLKWFLSSKSWLGELWFRPDLSALQRTRLKSGKSRNFKLYRYAENRVYRVRRRPDKQAPTPDPLRWPIENERVYEFPPPAVGRCSKITDPYALLLRLSQGTFDKPEKLCVFNKKTIYEVTLRREGVQRMRVHYRLGGKSVEASVKAEKITLLPRLMGKKPHDATEPFELLGMEGDITALIDPRHHLPLQFEGKVPGFGQAKLKLTEVKPRLQPAPN